MIEGICNRCLLDEVNKLFVQMDENGCSLDDCTYNMIIQALLRNKETFRGLQLLQEMFARGFSIDSRTLALLLGLLFDVRLDPSIKQILNKLF